MRTARRGLGILEPRKAQGGRAWVLGAGAALASIAIVAIRYRGISAYATVASVVLGAALLAVVMAMLDPDSPADAPEVAFRLNSFWVLLGGATIAMRVAAPGSTLLTWFLAPLFVMVMPGWSLGSALLPASTSNLERLCWAPALSLGALLVTLAWLDMMGAVVWYPTLFFLSIAFTVVGAAIARLR